jgi:hypothetical protein
VAKKINKQAILALFIAIVGGIGVLGLVYFHLKKGCDRAAKSRCCLMDSDCVFTPQVDCVVTITS